MLLKGCWALANFLAFLTRVIQRLLGLTVHHPGTMFGNTVFKIVDLSSGAIVAIFAFVGPLFLMLAFHMLFKGSSGTETLPSTRWPFTNYELSTDGLSDQAFLALQHHSGDTHIFLDLSFLLVVPLQVDLCQAGKAGLQMWRQGPVPAEHQKKKSALHLAEGQAPCAEVQLCSTQQQPSCVMTVK